MRRRFIRSYDLGLKKAIILCVCAILSVAFLSPREASAASITYSDGCWSGVGLNNPSSMTAVGTTIGWAPANGFGYAVGRVNSIVGTAVSATHIFGGASCGGSNPGTSVDLSSLMVGQPDGRYVIIEASFTSGYNFFTISGGVVTVDGASFPVLPEGIVDIVSPSAGSTVASGSVTFDVDVWNETSNRVIFNLTNFQFNGSIPPVVLYLPAVSGMVSTTTSRSLPDGFYSSTVQMVRSDGTVVDSEFITFTVGSNPYGFSSIASTSGAVASTTPTCTASSTDSWLAPLINFGCFLVVPSAEALANFQSLPAILETKIPFAYYYDVKNIIASSTANAASSTLGTFTLNIGTSTDPFHVSVVLFSPDTIRYFIPDELASALSLVTTSSIWIGFAWYMYRRITGLLANKTK